jgi:hypothetical protein
MVRIVLAAYHRLGRLSCPPRREPHVHSAAGRSAKTGEFVVSQQPVKPNHGDAAVPSEIIEHLIQFLVAFADKLVDSQAAVMAPARRKLKRMLKR